MPNVVFTGQVILFNRSNYGKKKGIPDVIIISITTVHRIKTLFIIYTSQQLKTCELLVVDLKPSKKEEKNLFNGNNQTRQRKCFLIDH